MLVFTESELIIQLTTSTPKHPMVSVSAESVDIDELICRICRIIKRETNLGVREMQVMFENGRLILNGYCRTFYTKQLAQQAVLAILGDIELVNNIRVV